MKLRDIRSLVNLEPPPRTVADRLTKTCHNVADARRLAARRLPPSVFDYIEGGAEDEVSLRRNRSSFDDWFFAPRWGAIENLDLSTTILGASTALPLLLSPTGGTRLFHPDGEIAVARAALAAGIPYGLAHLSTTPMESVSASAPGLRRWFNIEPTRDKRELQDAWCRCRPELEVVVVPRQRHLFNLVSRVALLLGAQCGFEHAFANNAGTFFANDPETKDAARFQPGIRDDGAGDTSSERRGSERPACTIADEGRSC